MPQVVSGVIAGLSGAFWFFYCVGIAREDGSDTCDTNGPGVLEGWLISVVTLVIHAVICWAAFLMLCCAKKKGKRQMLTEKEDEGPVPCCGDGGGGLRRFLWYDTVTVVICLGLLAATVLQTEGFSGTTRSRWSSAWASSPRPS